MPPILNVNAVIMCPHGGTVTLRPSQLSVLAGGGPVLREPDLIGAPVVGCTQPLSPTTKPCTAVLTTLPGSSSPIVSVGGLPAYLATLTGATDGVPPAVVKVVFPGQVVVQA